MHALKEYMRQHAVAAHEDRQQLGREIRKIRQEWNAQFNNQPYGQVIANLSK